MNKGTNHSFDFFINICLDTVNTLPRQLFSGTTFLNLISPNRNLWKMAKRKFFNSILCFFKFNTVKFNT